MNKLTVLLATLVVAGFGFAGSASAFNFGTGTGCSPIEGVEAVNLTDGDTFTGRIGRTGVDGFNKNGKDADDADADGFTDSIEECINDALVGYCTLVFSADSNITVVPGTISGARGNKREFTVTFDDTSGCDISQCSDHVDNDTDGQADFGGAIGLPADTDCDDYDDDDESS